MVRLTDSMVRVTESAGEVVDFDHPFIGSTDPRITVTRVVDAKGFRLHPQGFFDMLRSPVSETDSAEPLRVQRGVRYVT